MVTNYDCNRGFLTRLSPNYPGFLASIGELHVLKLSLELKFGLSSEFSNVSSNYLLESFVNDASALSCV